VVGKEKKDMLFSRPRERPLLPRRDKFSWLAKGKRKEQKKDKIRKKKTSLRVLHQPLPKKKIVGPEGTEKTGLYFQKHVRSL